MSRQWFLALPDWARLRESIEEQIQVQTEQALEAYAPDAALTLARREYARGWRDALRAVLELPNSILQDGEHEEGQKAPHEESAQEVKGQRVVPERDKRRVAPLHHLSRVY